MTSYVLQNPQNLRKVIHAFPSGMPLTSTHLAKWGVSRQLAHWYKTNGWLEQLGQGYFLRVGDKVTETGAVTALEANGVPVHFAGKSALGLRGFSHYLAMGQSKVYLCGAQARRLPRWLSEHFLVELSSGKLFLESGQVDQRLFVRRLDATVSDSPYVSDPERAILEMLDNIPLKQTMDEAKLIMEGMFSLNAEKVQRLLVLCTKVKVKRLFLSFAKELGLPVLQELEPSSLDCGAASIYTIQKARGQRSLALKNPLVVKHI